MSTNELSPAPAAAVSGWQRLRLAITEYREANRRELQGGGFGCWQELIEQIYAEHFAARHRRKFDQRRQTWQKYGKVK